MTLVQLSIPVISAIIGAFLGFLWQNKNERRKDKRYIIMTLMAYRGVGAREHDFVKALNMIDIVFYRNKKVRILLHEYFKHTIKPLFETGTYQKILIDLLHEMIRDIGYNNLKQTDIMDY